MSRRRRKVLPLLAVAVALALVVGVGILAWLIFSGRPPSPGPGPGPGPERPEAQSADCPDVQVVAIPGTWESSSADDPHNPTFNPASLMLNVTRALQQFPAERVDVYTVPYVAQFSNPIAIPPDGQQSYNASRTEGTDHATKVLADRYAQCPLTTYVLTGFSQGAVIAGDIAAQIGAGNGPVPEDLVLGVSLIADGRRADDQAIAIGPVPGGVGAEVALSGMRVPGITMTGPRPGFGTLTGRVYTMCAPTDLICDAPRDAMRPTNIVTSGLTLVSSIGNPVHTLYNSFEVEPGVTATQWTANWASGLIEGAPHPAHLPN